MFDWKGRAVLVTGGNGFIGSRLVNRLVREEANVVVLIRDIKKNAVYDYFNIGAKVAQVHGDLTDYGLMERVLNEYGVSCCFHLAAQALVQKANTKPLSTFESNIRGTWTLFEACRNAKTIERVVVASSDKAYGVQDRLPYTEESPLLAVYPYDVSKAAADMLAKSYHVTYGLPLAITRNANTYGGGDLNFSRIIPDAVRSILLDREFLIRSDGTPERDYMYVEDAVDGYLRLAEEIERDDVAGGVFNFGTGKPVSVVDLFKKIAALCGKPDVRPKILGEAKNEIDRQYLATDKARRILGWEPKYTLDQGLRETIAWYEQYFGAEGGEMHLREKAAL